MTTSNSKPLICAQCDHELEKLGSDWECKNRCRCTMSGCVPRSKKYRTERCPECRSVSLHKMDCTYGRRAEEKK